MKIKIYLHGHLKDKVGKPYVETEAKSVYEALRSLASRYEKKFTKPREIPRWKIKVKNYPSKESLMKPIRHNVIHVYPVFSTAKSLSLSGVINMVVGTALVVAGAITGNPALATAGTAIFLSGVYQTFFMPGLNVSEEVANNSKYLGAIGNTTAAGTRIPFGYGLYKVSGHFISYNVSSTTIKVIDKEQ